MRFPGGSVRNYSDATGRRNGLVELQQFQRGAAFIET